MNKSRLGENPPATSQKPTFKSNNPIKLNKHYQQIILACKGWNKEYSTRNTIERILSQYLGVDRKHIDQGHVYHFLVEIVNKVDSEELKKLYANLFYYGDSVSMSQLIKRLISVLSNIQVKEGSVDLIELEYDESIMNGICGSEV